MATLKEQRTALLDQAHSIIDAAKAANDRDLTDAEEQQVKSLLDSIDSLDDSIARSERVGALLHRINNGPETVEPSPGRTGTFPTKSHVSLGRVAPEAFAAMRKAPVAAGSTVIEVELVPGIIPADRAPLTLLDALPAVLRESPVYRVLKRVPALAERVGRRARCKQARQHLHRSERGFPLARGGQR